MMMVSAKQLSEISARVESARLSGELGLSRRAQALLAGCGESEPTKPWFVLTVRPGLENDVDKLLNEAGIQSWMPSLEVKVRRRSRYGGTRPEDVKVPVWPGYLFVRTVNSAAAWAAISRVDGVVGVLGTAESPAPIKDSIVLKLKVKLEHDQDARDILEDEMKEGQRVSIDYGPFKSFEGLVETMLGLDRVRVEVHLFGRATAVELELAQITKIR